MKKILLIWLVLIGVVVNATDYGETSANVDTTATILNDLVIETGGNIDDFITDTTSGNVIGSGIDGDSVALGSIFVGDSKNTWDKITEDQHPALITIRSNESITSNQAITASALIEYKLEDTKVTINGPNSDTLDVNLSVSQNASQGTAVPTDYNSTEAEAQLRNGEYKFLIHGTATTDQNQAIGAYSGSFTVYGRYSPNNTWY